jgi:hypothetical protein
MNAVVNIAPVKINTQINKEGLLVWQIYPKIKSTLLGSFIIYSSIDYFNHSSIMQELE